MVVMYLDNRTDRLKKVLSAISKHGLNTFLILSKELETSHDFNQHLRKLNMSGNTEADIRYCEGTSDIVEKLEGYEKDINKNASKLFVVVSDKYNGEENAKTPYILTNQQLVYIDTKVKMLSMMVACFLKANKERLAGTRLLYNKPDYSSNTVDSMIFESFLFHLESVKNEVLEFSTKLCSDI